MIPFPAKFSPEMYTVYRSDTDCHNKLRGGGADFGAKCRSNLEYFQEYVWMEITITDGRNLLIGNHYFAPDL
jgi:hypothetical protein